MKRRIQLCMAFCCLMGMSVPVNAEKTFGTLVQNGAWAIHSQPSAVYYNGKTYFAYITSDKKLMAASYDHKSGIVTEKVVASSGFTDNFCAPSIIVRGSGQLMLFAQANQKENGWQVWYSSNTEDVSAWSAAQSQTGYGISSTSPYFMGNDLVVFWRQKNALGYSLFQNVKAGTSNMASVKTRKSLIATNIGSKYAYRDEVPTMRAVQAADGSLHAVFTHLGTGKLYTSSQIHYAHLVKSASGTTLEAYKADGEKIGTMKRSDDGDPLDTIACGWEKDKVQAYDITLDAEGRPCVLYDAFEATEDDNTGNHSFYLARWDGNKWVKKLIAEAGGGFNPSTYTAVQGNKYTTTPYMTGGLCFKTGDPNTVYLSKKTDDNTFSLYCYTTTDEGTTWSERAVLPQSVEKGVMNIHPLQVTGAPSNYPFGVLWMQGSYTNPTEYKTSIVTDEDLLPPTAITLGADSLECVVGDSLKLNIGFVPASAKDTAVNIVSATPDVVEVLPGGMVRGLSIGDGIVTVSSRSNPQVSTSIKINVVKESIFDVFMDRVVDETALKSAGNIDNTVAGYIKLLNSEGGFTDVNYASTVRTNWPPMTHLNRMLSMAQAYTCSGSKYYANADMKEKLDKMLAYWQQKAPKSNNWYQNEIGEPQRMGKFLILMQKCGAEKIPTNLFNNAIERLKSKGGDPSKQTGANRTDVALHWMFRACLTHDESLLKSAMNSIYSVVNYTTGNEGIQYDNSFTQHGHQLHIGQYGESFLEGVTKACVYGLGTRYQIPEAKVKILAGFLSNYVQTIRGHYISYNVVGRAITRTSAISRYGQSDILRRMVKIDPQNATLYNHALSRLSDQQPATYDIDSRATHFFCTDYTLVRRPAYTIDLRMVSTRTARNEILKENGEGLKSYFLADGSTNIQVDGDEYYNVFPAWNWAMIPGVTCPEFTTIPQAPSYITMGQNSFTGGVTDSLYAVSAYRYVDTKFNINSSANKAWFFFDKEMVCLGNGITSTSDSRINTTVNQTRLKGNVTVSVNGRESSKALLETEYPNGVDWVFHNKVGYYFPQRGDIRLQAAAREGAWVDINTNYSSEVFSQNVFTLAFNHGIAPKNEKYAYIVVPGLKSLAQARGYHPSDIEILRNDDSIQAVYNKRLGIYGIVFLKACNFAGADVEVNTSAPCAVLLKDADKDTVQIHVANPNAWSSAINLGVLTKQFKGRRQITYQQKSPYAGRSQKFSVTTTTPVIPGMEDQVVAVKNATVGESNLTLNAGVVNRGTPISVLSPAKVDGCALYDATGCLVARSESRNLPTESLSSGIYLLRVQTSVGMQTAKVVVR